MEKLKDINGNIVYLTFDKESFKNDAKHVFVICKFQDFWVMTKHKERGLEFPGGKLEKGETLEEAARREVLEETGGIISDIRHIGQYEVHGIHDQFVKNIYLALISHFQNQNHFYETEGRVLLKSELMPADIGEEFSFIMKDDVLQKSLQYIRDNRLI